MITIVTQCSVSRLFTSIHELTKSWNEVISLAIYIKMEDNLLESEIIIDSFFRFVEENSDAILDISILYETEYSNAVNSQTITENKKYIKYPRYFSENKVLYPINHLRNIALQMAQTDFVLLLDVDFIPSDNFTYHIKKYYRKYLNQMKHNSNVVFVVAAFEFTNETSINYQVPTNISDVIKLYENGICDRFHKKCKTCHTATNYKLFSKLANSTIESNYTKIHKPDQIDPRRNYEPYILVNRKHLNRYDARFRGYGFNKIIHIRHLRISQKRKTFVLPNLFVFHRPHPESLMSKAWQTVK